MFLELLLNPTWMCGKSEVEAVWSDSPEMTKKFMEVPIQLICVTGGILQTECPVECLVHRKQ